MFWRLRTALKLFWFRFRHPLLRVEAHSWDTMDHYHICYAARILNGRDFGQICPIKHSRDTIIELNDQCDFCPYFGIVTFHKNAEGKKYVDFQIEGGRHTRGR